jgi:predicted aspartyl protease
VYLEMQTNQRLGTRKLGMELKSLGYNQEMKTVNGKYKRAYFIELKK